MLKRLSAKLQHSIILALLAVYGVYIFAPLYLLHSLFERLLIYADRGGYYIAKFFERKHN